MSRIGKQPIKVPSGVKVELKGAQVAVEGPQGKLSRAFSPNMKITLDNGILSVERPNNSKQNRELHGLTRALLANMVEGANKGFSRSLEIVGVGYSAKTQGQSLNVDVGFANTVSKVIPSGIKVETPGGTRIVISGPDKQAVGQLAAEVRKIRPPEPYKGKGIRYVGEVVRRKAGKAFAAGAA